MRSQGAMARRNARKVACPTCGQAVNDDCVDPRGQWKPLPHIARVLLERQHSHEQGGVDAQDPAPPVPQ